MICEHCGLQVKVGIGTAKCGGCGTMLAPTEGQTLFPCPSCGTKVQHVVAIKAQSDADIHDATR
jgi:LSD1 subclass zinc finger protein